MDIKEYLDNAPIYIPIIIGLGIGSLVAVLAMALLLFYDSIMKFIKKRRKKNARV